MSDYLYRNRFLRVSTCESGWWGVGINSGYEEHQPFLKLIGFRRFVSINLPKWVVQPHRRKVLAQTWDAATVARMGRDWYWDETRREFGIGLHGDSLSVHYGVQPDSWPGDKSWRWQLPWTRLQHIEDRWIGLDGEVCAVSPASLDYDQQRAIKEAAPSMRFAFSDFDGTRVEANVRIEEFEFSRRRGWRWLDRITGRKSGRRFDIALDKESGPEKGSWKGGMLGCSGVAEPGEMHESAFRRWAAKEHGMTQITRLP